ASPVTPRCPCLGCASAEGRPVGPGSQCTTRPARGSGLVHPGPPAHPPPTEAAPPLPLDGLRRINDGYTESVRGGEGARSCKRNPVRNVWGNVRCAEYRVARCLRSGWKSTSVASPSCLAVRKRLK